MWIFICIGIGKGAAADIGRILFEEDVVIGIAEKSWFWSIPSVVFENELIFVDGA